jgi:hypothetical protein
VQKAELIVIVQSIINSNTKQNQIAHVKQLSAFLQNAVNTGAPLPSDNHSDTKGGQALSSYHAAACTDDYLRTALFIKGVYKAITQLCTNFPSQEINILYAGCGPYATLLLPLLPLFDSAKLSIVLLDLHSESINSAKQLAGHLGLTPYNLTFTVANAITYTCPAGWPVDLLISETMHYGLTLEPQVAISKNLVTYLAPHGILIPQEITIDLVYSFYAKEPFISTLNPTQNITPYTGRQHNGRVLTINKDILLVALPDQENIISQEFTLPADFSTCPDMCLFTEVRILDELVLKTSESLITNPYCITSLYNIEGADRFTLEYNFSEAPTWTLHLDN